MSRLSVLVSRPRRTLAALATVLVAVGITAASGADFTATSANADTTFATGTLSITNTKQGLALWSSTADMRPGDPARVGTVDITNAGSLSGAFTLNRGTVADLTTDVNLGTYAGGAQHRYEFSVDVDGASNNYQGKSSVVPFSWAAA